MSQITKRALEASLKDLLKTKPLDKITISDITNNCGVNRMTFYYHFKDIYDLIEWICVTDASDAIKDNKTYDTWQEGFLQIFEEVKSNKIFITSVYQSVKREEVENYLYKMTYDLLYTIIDERCVGKDISEENKVFITNFYKYAFVGILIEWINDGMKTDPHNIIYKLGILIKGNVNKAIDAYSVSNNNK